MTFQNNPNATATMPMTTPVVVMSEGFEGAVTLGKGGWWPWYDGSVSVATSGAHTGTRCLKFSDAGDGPGVDFNIDHLGIADLEVTLSFWAKGTAGIHLVPLPSFSTPSDTITLNATWTKYEITGTVTSGTGNWLTFNTWGEIPGAVAFLDDIQITTLTPRLRLSDGDLTLDASRYPFADASVEVPFTSEGLQEEIKPGQRVILNATSAGSWNTVYTWWTIKATNYASHPSPLVTSGNGWGMAYGGVSVPGWMVANVTATTTAYTFTDAFEEAIQPGDVVTMAVTYRVDANVGAATHIRAVPHIRTGNVYIVPTLTELQDTDTLRPIVLGQEERVVVRWVADRAIAAQLLEIALTSASDQGSFAAVDSGFNWRAGRLTLERGVTSGDYFDGNTSPDDSLHQYRWTGTANASVSVFESRQVDHVDWVPSPGVTANLTLTSREISHDGKKISLKLASDEALLEQWSDVVDDSTPRTHEGNLRDLINYVLNKAIPGAALQPGTANADVTATWAGTNLIPNPVGGVSTLGWVAGATGGTIAVVAGGRTTNPYRIRVSNAAAGYVGGPFYSTAGSAGIRVTPGKTYTSSAWVRSNRAISVRLSHQVVTDGSGSVPGNLQGPIVALVANTWTYLTATFRIPANVVRIGPYVYPSSGSYAAASWIDIDEVMVFDSFEALPQFNGATPDTSLYTYQWDDETTPFDSQSSREPVIDRPRELFTWEAGTTAWDFLSPLVASAGLRLFCDEQRRWWLIDPANWTVPGRFSARPDNTVQGSDTMDADSEESGYTGVVTVFKWTDVNGDSLTKKEFAGEMGKVKLLEFDTPFIGGIAAAHLTKIQGLGRVQDVTVATDYTVRPGQEVQIDLPGTAPQLGTLNSVQWELTNGLMSIGSAGLRETPVGAIDLLNGTIDGLTGSVDSL